MVNSTWYELNASRPKIVKQAIDSFEELARKHAFRFHAEAQKTKNKHLYGAAKDLYAKYIKFFPKTVHSAKVRFYLAEIYYKQENYLKAAYHYYVHKSLRLQMVILHELHQKHYHDA